GVQTDGDFRVLLDQIEEGSVSVAVGILENVAKVADRLMIVQGEYEAKRHGLVLSREERRSDARFFKGFSFARARGTLTIRARSVSDGTDRPVAHAPGSEISEGCGRTGTRRLGFVSFSFYSVNSPRSSPKTPAMSHGRKRSRLVDAACRPDHRGLLAGGRANLLAHPRAEDRLRPRRPAVGLHGHADLAGHAHPSRSRRRFASLR